LLTQAAGFFAVQKRAGVQRTHPAVAKTIGSAIRVRTEWHKDKLKPLAFLSLAIRIFRSYNFSY
jgi:hypothetical protein